MWALGYMHPWSFALSVLCGRHGRPQQGQYQAASMMRHIVTYISRRPCPVAFCGEIVA